MTYPKGDPRSSINHPNMHKRHLKKLALASLIVTLLFSYMISGLFINIKNKDSTINLIGSTLTQTVRQTEGPHTISYKTTGPLFSSFYMACTPSGVPFDFGPLYNCLELKYNGKGGAAELKIPSVLLKELPWIHKVSASPFVDASFQLVSQDDFYRVYRIQLPVGYDSISLVGGTKTDFPYWSLFSLLALGGVIFLLLWVGLIVLCERLAILRNRSWFVAK